MGFPTRQLVPNPSVATSGYAIFDNGGTYVLDTVAGSAFGFPALGMKGGSYYTTPFALSVAPSTVTAGKEVCSPIWVPPGTEIDKIATRLMSTGASAQNGCKLTLREDNGQGYPGAIIAESAIFNMGVVGEISYAISTTLNNGLYWLGYIAFTFTSPQADVLLCRGGTSLPTTNLLSDYNQTDLGSYEQAATIAYADRNNPLPDPFAAGAVFASNNYHAMVFIHTV